MSSIIWTDQTDANGRTIHYNVDRPTREIASDFHAARLDDELLEVPNEKKGEEPIFVNPDHVATIAPTKED